MNPKPFCPQCTAEWDRPWYDICPSCGHRFMGRPWWQSPSLIMALIGLPAIALLILGFLTGASSEMKDWNLEGIALGITLIGGPIGAIGAAVLVSIRGDKTGGALVGWSILWAVVFSIVSLTLCFFSCLYSFSQ